MSQWCQTSKEDFVDYYAVLNSSPSSTEEQIQAEFKILALKTHPDKTNRTNWEDFQLLLEAKEVLTNPSERAIYDRWRESGIRVDYRTWRNMNKGALFFHWRTIRDPGNMLPAGEHREKQPQDPGAGKLETYRINPEEITSDRLGVRTLSSDPDSVVRRFRLYQL